MPLEQDQGFISMEDYVFSVAENMEKAGFGPLSDVEIQSLAAEYKQRSDLSRRNMGLPPQIEGGLLQNG